MTDKKISELAVLTVPTLDDLLAIVNSGDTKQISVDNLLSSLRDQLTYVEIDHTDSPYTVADNISVVLVDTSGGNVTVALPALAASNKNRIWIKNLGAGTVTVDGDGTEEIDGDETKVLAQFSTLQVLAASTGWWIL